MITGKYMGRITAAFMAAAVVFTLFFTYAPQMMPITAAAAAPAYATKLFDKDALMTIDIQVEEDQWQEMLDNATAEEYVPCDLVINGTTFSTVGVRPKGNTSLSQVASSDSDRYSFKFEFDHYIDGQTCYGLDKLVVNNLISDATYMKEYLSYDLMSFIGVDTPLYAFAKISVNGEYWGIYLALEAVEESFVERVYGSLNGNLYKPDSMDMGGGGMPGGDRDEDKDAFGAFQKEDGGQEEKGDTEGTGDTLQTQSQASGSPPKTGGNQGESTQPSPGTPSGNRGDGAVPAGESDDENAPSGNFPGGGMPNGTPPSESGGQEDKALPAAASLQNGGTSESDSTLESDATSEHNDTDASGNTSSPAAGESPTPPSGGQGFPGMADTEKDGNFGGRGGGGADLAYTDDEIDSYSTIFDSAVFDSDEADYERVIEALKQLNEGADLESAVDVDSTLRYIAANAVLVNLDSYFGTMLHNYYLYEEDGRLSVLPWDYNLSFGGFQSGDASAAVNFPIDTPVSGATLAERPLIGKLLEVEEYQETYHSYLRQIVNGYFMNGTFANTIKMIDSLIGDYVRTDPTAFYTYDEYVEATGMLEDFGQLRALSVDGQLNGTIPSTTDGQKKDSASLIDASSINLAVMGTQGGMGGGRAEMGMGRPDGMGNDTAGQAGESSGQSGEAAGQPGESTGQPGEAAVKTDDATDQTGDVPGQPPGGTDTPDGEDPSGFPGGGQDVQMPDADTIAKALEIVGEDTDKLSGEQKAQLLELGLSEEQIAMVQQMLTGGGNFPGGGKMLRTGSMPGAGQDNGSSLIELAIAGGGAAILLLATAFAALKRRRRDVRR